MKLATKRDVTRMAFDFDIRVNTFNDAGSWVTTLDAPPGHVMAASTCSFCRVETHGTKPGHWAAVMHDLKEGTYQD